MARRARHLALIMMAVAAGAARIRTELVLPANANRTSPVLVDLEEETAPAGLQAALQAAFAPLRLAPVAAQPARLDQVLRTSLRSAVRVQGEAVDASRVALELELCAAAAPADGCVWHDTVYRARVVNESGPGVEVRVAPALAEALTLTLQQADVGQLVFAWTVDTVDSLEALLNETLQSFNLWLLADPEHTSPGNAGDADKQPLLAGSSNATTVDQFVARLGQRLAPAPGQPLRAPAGERNAVVNATCLRDLDGAPVCLQPFTVYAAVLEAQFASHVLRAPLVFATAEAEPTRAPPDVTAVAVGATGVLLQHEHALPATQRVTQYGVEVTLLPAKPPADLQGYIASINASSATVSN